ncbi:VWA-like domain-containing protein [Streptomyces griseoincarnatus]
MPTSLSAPSPLDIAADLLALLRDTTTEPRSDVQLEALTLAVSADLPVLLWGEPGIGKTAALTQLAAALDLPLTTVIASVHEPSDFSGLPVVGDDPAEQGVPMAPPDWAVRLVRAGRGLLFLDELSTAPPAVSGSGDDYSYGRPSRRSAGVPGAVLPSLRRTPPRVSVVVDTSGSVSDAELGSALLEVTAISRAVGGRRDLVSVVPCDAAPHEVHRLCRAEGIPLVGGGGTDLRAGVTRALGARPRPDVLVVLTDGQTRWPSSRPPCRTVVGLFPRPPRRTREEDPEYRPDTPPEWARVVTGGEPQG